MRICEETKKLADAGRHVLVLSHRRGHSMEICKMLQSNGIDAKTYLGGDKNAPDALVICATFSLASEGYDNPKLSALVLATPSSDVIQACGRILRGGKETNPVIVDFADHYSLCLGQLAKRTSFYRKIGFRMDGDQQRREELTTATAEISKKMESMFIDDD
jgi:superfamily II DNA or RNA helicase